MPAAYLPHHPVGFASRRAPSLACQHVNLQDFLVTRTGTKLAMRLSALLPRRMA
jgi:hypothetical protein